MNPTRDDAHRARALTDLDATLLVEASAGTGKTSLLAGRVAMLLADGRAASGIAAITFTERAAAELRHRVESFCERLARGHVPGDLAPAFRTQPLTEPQRAALESAMPQLGDLTAGTIHAFCLSILQSYAVEARIDPGAAVMNAEQTDLAFESVLSAWLNERLGTSADPSDPIVIMAADDPARTVKLLRTLAVFRRAHPDAKPMPAPSYADAAHDFIDAVSAFRRWISGVASPDAAINDVVQLEALVSFVAAAADGTLSFEEILHLLHPESPILLERDSRQLFQYRPRQRDWKATSGPVDGPQNSQTAGAHYETCGTLFIELMGALADTLLSRYFDETDSLMERFERYKLSAAMLDFDDILIRTRALLRNDESVRRSVAKRFHQVLVDEFQDTDPIQTEILFLITGSGKADGSDLAAGKLFLVGDPKQAIYRFRSADLKTYVQTRALIEARFPGNVLHVFANFRSDQRILKHVDQVFATRLAAQLGSYDPLEPTVADQRVMGVARLPYYAKDQKWAFVTRESEANAIAGLCASLVGNVNVRRRSGEITLCEPGDIALLAPTGTDLWRYERALEDKGLPVASQAGKNLYRRQESQDFVSLIRALADSRDTLALGALLRGPLVGLTDHELLDITLALRVQDKNAVLRLRRDPPAMEHVLAAQVMEILQDLWRRRRGTTPYALLAEAVDRLRAVPSIAMRSPDQRDRALANLNGLLERARTYDARGLKQLAVDLSSEWESGASANEAPADHAGDSINIVTIHKAKGLEWPIVIPVNLIAMSRRSDEFFHRLSDDSIHWTLGDVASSTLQAAIAANKTEVLNERERLLYVACTRARDLLIVPDPSWTRSDSWFQFLNLGQELLSEFVLPTPRSLPDAPRQVNSQTRAVFAAEQNRLRQASGDLQWLRPSVDDADRELMDRITAAAPSDSELDEASARIVGAGARRGVILHRLLEEMISGLCAVDLPALLTRSEQLLLEAPSDGLAPPEPNELARTALASYTHPALTPYRGKLLAEVTLLGSRSTDVLVSARADAIALNDSVAIAAFDWKSDVAPDARTRRDHKGQLAQYLQLIGAPIGAIVYLSHLEFQWIAADGSDHAPG